MWNWLKSAIGFIGRVIKSTIEITVEYVKEVVVNAPAVAIMVTSAMGITGIATNMGAESLFVSIAFLNETLVVYFLSVSIVLILATMAGKIA